MYLGLGWGGEVPVLQTQGSALWAEQGGLFPRERRFQRGARATRTTCYRLGPGDLSSAFNVATTQLGTLGKSFFPVWPVIHRIRMLRQRVLKPQSNSKTQ